MSYLRKVDANGHPINEAIERIEQRIIDVNVEYRDFKIQVPKGSYGFWIRQADIPLELKVNDWDYLSFGRDDYISPILNGVQTLLLNTYGTSTNKLVIYFVR